MQSGAVLWGIVVQCQRRSKILVPQGRGPTSTLKNRCSSIDGSFCFEMADHATRPTQWEAYGRIACVGMSSGLQLGPASHCDFWPGEIEKADEVDLRRGGAQGRRPRFLCSRTLCSIGSYSSTAGNSDRHGTMGSRSSGNPIFCELNKIAINPVFDVNLR